MKLKMEQVHLLESIFTSRAKTSVDRDQVSALVLKLDMAAFSMLRVYGKIFKCI